MFGQIVFLHLGQAGIQIANAFWELICIEHGVSPDGEVLFAENVISDYDNLTSLFNIGNHGTYTPRAIFIDGEPNIIDEIKTGVYRTLFNQTMMLNYTEDAANNYARGSYTIGRKLIKKICENIRKISERTETLKGFYIFNSTGGGTGSGLSPLILFNLLREFPKITRSSFCNVPGHTYSSAIVEPYNTVLQNFTTIQTSDVCFLFDNESIHDICLKKLLYNCPTYSELNRILAMMFSSINGPVRYTSMLQTSVDDIMTNLIPYPRIHFPFLRFSPLRHISRTSYDNISTMDLTTELFSTDTQSMNVDTRCGLFISIILNYQGRLNTKEIHESIEKHKTSKLNKFVEWSPASFKVGICNQIPTMSPMLQLASTDKAASMLINSTAISQFFISEYKRFNLLFKKRAFLHWYYCEGMEFTEFSEAQTDIHFLIEDFNEIRMSKNEIMDVSRDTINTSKFSISVRSPGISYKNP